MIRLFIFIFTYLFAVSLSAQKDTAFIYTFGGDQDEQGRDIELTADSGFIMVGATSSFGNGNSDIYLVKVDSNIKYQWSRAIGHFHLEFGHAVKQTKDGGYVICGYSNSKGNGGYDGYLVRTDDTGAVVWEKYFGGFDWDKFYDVELTPDGGFMLVGESNSFGAGDADAWIVKTDSLRNLEWEKFLGGKGKDIAHALISTKDGNYAFCGENTNENKGQSSMWFVKFSNESVISINKNYPKTQNEKAFGILEMKNGSFILVGQKQKMDSIRIDESLIMVDNKGDFLKGIESFYGINEDVLKDIIEGKNGLLFSAGYSSSFGNGGAKGIFGVRSISISQNLDLLYGPVLGNGKFNQKGFKIIENHNGNRLIIGTYGGSKNPYTDIGVTIYKNDTVAQDYDVLEEAPYNDLSLNKSLGLISISRKASSIYPNPAKDFVNILIDHNSKIIKIEVLDLNGKVLGKYFTNLTQINIANFNSGVLILKLYYEIQSPATFKVIHE